MRTALTARSASRDNSRFVVTGFIVGCLIFFCSLHELKTHWQARELKLAVGGSLRPSFALQIHDVGRARAQHLFWVLYPNGIGTAIDALNDVEIFSQLFPGYSSMRNDLGFWKRYFNFDMSIETMCPSMSPNTEATVMTSWFGGFEIVRSYGADIVLLGSSETFSTLIPSVLADALRRRAGREVRVLSVARGGMTSFIAGLTAKQLAATGGHARVAVWGYSAWNAFTRNPIQAANNQSTAALYKRSQNRLWVALQPAIARFKRIPEWSDIVPMTYGQWRNGAVEQKDADHKFPTDLIATREKFIEKMEALSPYYERLDGIGEHDCDLTEASKAVDAVIADLLRFADRVIIYIPPTTPIQTGAAPACYLPAVRTMLASKGSLRVTVKVDDWRSYGLDWTDFIKHSRVPGLSWIDTNHTNYAGAMKTTAALTPLVTDAFTPTHGSQKAATFAN